MFTPIEEYNGILFKRDDLYEIAGVRGGKARTCLTLASKATKGLTTAGSRSSPQVNIVANIARHLGLPCVAHTPQGILNKELALAQAAGCQIIQHKAGYNSVIISRSRNYAAETGYTDIPFGMECQEAVDATALQVADLPWGDFKRIVMPIGGGMSFAGVLTGLLKYRPVWCTDLEVLGVKVGADPIKRLNRWAPIGWYPHCTIVDAPYRYDEYVDTVAAPFILDPVYEAKCQHYLKPGDLMWCVGIRQSCI